MIDVKEEDENYGSPKADAFVRICRVSAMELCKGVE